MQDKRTDHLNTIEGEGEAFDEQGVSVGKTRYSLDIYQDMIIVHTKDGVDEVPGNKRVGGVVTDLDTFALLGKSLVLKLQDGRTFPFFIQNSDGNIAPKGGISDA